MKSPLSLTCSVAALVIATLGSTPLGEAARNAASQVIPRNSVGTPQLKRNAVTASKLAPNSVRSAHVLDGSLLAADFKAGQIPQGPRGDKGDKGERGEIGPTEGVAAADPETAAPTGATNQFVFSQNLASTFTTSHAGRLLLLKDFNASISCPTAPSSAWWWLTLDGAVVTSSFRIVGASATAVGQLSISGVTAQSVPAGNHTLGVQAMCFAGTSGGGSASFYSGGNVVVLG